MFAENPGAGRGQWGRLMMDDQKTLTGTETEGEAGAGWVPPLATIINTDIVDTAGNTGAGGDGGSGGFNAS